MARIRSVKPDLRTSLTVAQWPREVRYFWVLLWGYLDDHGFGVDEPKIIKADCFPLDDDLGPDDINKWLTLIASTITAPGEPPPLCRYEAGGRRYLHAPKWAEHQRPQHPAFPKFPVCSSSHDSLVSMSGESHETHSQGGQSPPNGVPETTSGESHETVRKPPESLTPEGVVVVGDGRREGVAGRARTRPESTLLANSLLDEHKRLTKTTIPREVLRRTGEQIDSLLDEPETTPDEVREALRRLRSNRRWGSGMLPNLVDEIRKEQAGEGAPAQRDYHQEAEQAKTSRAMQRAAAREGPA